MATEENGARRPNAQPDPASAPGPIRWMAHNHVAANLLLLVFLLGGAISMFQVNREVFPEARLDLITVTVAYPGATPAEIVESIVLPVEEAMRGVEGIEEIRASASEGTGRVSAEIVRGADSNQVLNDIENAVNRITSFPQDAEEPVISLPSTQSQVLSLILYGDADRHALDRIATQTRAALLRDERISRVEVTGIPPPEISIEVPQANLRRYGLTLPQIGSRVSDATVETGLGQIETAAGNVLLRIMEKREVAEAFRDIAIITTPEGVRLRLGDIATIRETFREDDRAAWFNGQPAVNLSVFRGADQDPQATAAAVREFLQRQQPHWGEGLNSVIWNDFSRIYEDRINLLVKNGLWGLGFVLIVLGVFLRPQLAFWVMLGIPASLLGVFIFLPMVDVSINMISLFAFILVLGILVDDAIVVGEAAFYQRRYYKDPLRAAIAGAREVCLPVVFAITTTVLAFMPMLAIPGVMGEFFRVIPLSVIPILIISLIESLFVLPTHIGHSRASKGDVDAEHHGDDSAAPERRSRASRLRRLAERQQRFSAWFERQVDTRYRRFIEQVITWRYLTVAASVALLGVSVMAYASDHLRFNFFPDIEGDTVIVEIEMVQGSSIDATRRAMQRVASAVGEVLAEKKADKELSEGTLALLGQHFVQQDDPATAGGVSVGSHLATVITTLVPAERREVSAAEIAADWRKKVGAIAGVQRLEFTVSVGPTAGADVAFELSHEDEAVLEHAAERLAERLAMIENVAEVDPGFRRGNQEIRLRLRPGAKALGITEQELARQVRAAFFGFEAVRQQRGRDELRVYVRLPEAQRQTLETIERFVVFTQGGEIPLEQAAYIEWDRSYTRIDRENGRRVVNVTGDVPPRAGTANVVTQQVLNDILPALRQDYPGLEWEVAGEQQEQQETLGALANGFALAFLAMYALLAAIFRSYVQPLLVMLAIPFGVIGAVLGHLLLGFEMSLISVLGLVALAGVVVNDSLVLIDVINRRRREGEEARTAIVEGCIRRFRPVLLTSLTTFAGLAPMIAETSIQARFLIPMAISLGIGVIFVTPITLMLVPALYRIMVGQRAEDRGQRTETEEK